MPCSVKKLCLLTLMGLPASGKTTSAEKVKRTFKDSRDTMCVLLQYDEFIPPSVQAQFGSQNQLAKVVRKNFVACVQYLASKLLQKENISDLATELSPDADAVLPRDEFIQRVDALWDQLREGAFENGFLVIDDNNYYKSMRNDFYQVAKAVECSFCVLYTTCSVKESQDRNSARPLENRVPAETIEEMSQKIEVPDPMENPCDLFCVQIISNNDPLEDIDSAVKTLLQHSLLNPVIYIPPPDRSEDRRILSESDVHQADLVLRKWINSQMTIASFTTSKTPSSRRTYSLELNSKKSQLLQKLKAGDFKLRATVSQEIEFRDEIVKLFKNISLDESKEQ